MRCVSSNKRVRRIKAFGSRATQQKATWVGVGSQAYCWTKEKRKSDVFQKGGTCCWSCWCAPPAQNVLHITTLGCNIPKNRSWRCASFFSPTVDRTQRHSLQPCARFPWLSSLVAAHRGNFFQKKNAHLTILFRYSFSDFFKPNKILRWKTHCARAKAYKITESTLEKKQRYHCDCVAKETQERVSE